MAKDLQLTATRPGKSAIAPCSARVFHPGDRIETPSGSRPVAKLRPGDPVSFDGGDGLVVLWMAMSRAETTDRPAIRVMFGTPGEPRRNTSPLPVGGRISSATGKLTLEKNIARKPARTPRLH